MAPSTSKVGRLPLIYRMHGAVYRALTAFGHVTIRGIHVFTVVANLLNRFAFKTYLSDPRALETATKEGFRMLVPLNDQSSASVMFRGEYDTDQAKAIANLLSVTSAMLDIGANLGYFSLLAAQNTKPDFPIIAVEPNAELCELIGSSIGLNGFGNVSVVRAAAGEAVGRANLELDIRRSSNATVTFEGTESESAVDVLTVDTLAECLPDELEAPPLVKIDVEGLEIPVLNGGRGVLSTGAIALCEVSRRSAERIGPLLAELGYVALDYFGRSVDLDLLGKRRQTDVVMCPANFADRVRVALEQAPQQQPPGYPSNHVRDLR